MRRYLLSIAVLALVALGASSVGAQAQWTTYHGDPALSGVDQSSGTGLPVSPAWTVVTVRLRVPRHERITRVTVYIGHHRILRRRGARLRRIKLAHLRNARVTLRVLETPRHGARFTLTVHVRGCRVRRVRA